ncbi:enoyl-CoA hydratase-related protein [Sporosarcina sp. E16_8]|uniref:enoyl-CoA hydratase-related protein n=1 Tax=Sporosarcina sp. E16_8 TaxID=2789295 RepID=UPI001A930627|nr:enoyl-CoA hydratase-related protein [Sporosarcina sp. E16_8]MBO0586256.1 enoyl-CoA hydratase/isomerase family protein [Sporosarcina sp. E16_8]
MSRNFTNLLIEDEIAIVEIDHAPANTLSTACIAELREVFKSLANDDKLKAIILTGAGRFFVAGADIKEFIDALGDDQKGLAMATAGQAICNEIESMNKPVIAAINGACLGGGLELAMSCHYRIAVSTAKLGLPELQLGLIPTFGGTQRLSRITSTATALELILASKQLNGDEGKEAGLIQLVVSSDDLLPTAKMIAKAFVDGKSMTSVTRAVECIIQGANESLVNGLERERNNFAELFLTDDAKEGVHAFIEKRKPVFKHT